MSSYFSSKGVQKKEVENKDAPLKQQPLLTKLKVGQPVQEPSPLVLKVQLLGKPQSKFLQSLKSNPVPPSRFSIKKQPQAPQQQQQQQQSNGILSKTSFFFKGLLPTTSKSKLKLKYVLKIQATYRANKIRKWLKQYKYRRNVIRELIKTEEAYVADLDIIIKHILEPMEQTKIITLEQIKIIESNIKVLRQLNGEFLEKIKNRFKNGYIGPLQLIGDLLQDYVPFFKVYFQYYNDYKQIDLTIQQLKKENSKFNAFSINMSKSKEFRFLDVESFTVKPVQRLPKYVLLLNDLLKHTNKDHPDYENIRTASVSYSEVTEKNNMNLDKVIQNYKLFELSKNFPEITIVGSNRNFISEIQLSMFQNYKITAVIVYILSDMVIVAASNESKPKLEKQIMLSPQSVVKSLENTQYFSNLLNLIGDNDVITFVEQSSDLKEIRISQFEQVILELKLKSDSRINAYNKNDIKNIQQHLIEVNIVGTEQRHTGAIKAYTVYIIEVMISNIQQRIYLRYSELKEAQVDMQKQFPKIQLYHLEDRKWQSGKSAKEVETRSINIASFLTTLLQSQDFKNSELNASILMKLGLPQDFYQLPDLSVSELNSPQRQRSNNLNMETPTSDSEQPMTIKILSYHPTKPSIELVINKDSTTLDLYSLMVDELDMDDMFDFKFLIPISKTKTFRLLADDEILMKLFASNIISDKREIHYRKYLYLELDREEYQLSSDPTKLNMVYLQFINELSNYFFTFKDYYQLAALYLFVNFIPVDMFQHIPIDKLLGNFIPPTILKNTKKELWQQYITDMYVLILKQNETDGLLRLTDQMNNVQLQFVTTVLQNQLCGQHLFQVQPSKDTSVLLKTADNHIHIGIGIQGLIFFDHRKKEKLLLIDYPSLNAIKPFAGGLQIGDKVSKYNFTCQDAYQVKQLVDEYLRMLQTIKNGVVNLN